MEKNFYSLKQSFLLLFIHTKCIKIEKVIILQLPPIEFINNSTEVD